MTATEALSRLAAGLSVSLTVFAAMLLLTYVRHLHGAPIGRVVETARRCNATAWTLIALSVLAYRPLHTGWLLGHAAPPLLSRLGELIAVGFANAAIILVLAARGLLIGISPRRVARGALVNFTVAFLIVSTTWLTP